MNPYNSSEEFENKLLLTAETRRTAETRWKLPKVSESSDSIRDFFGKFRNLSEVSEFFRNLSKFTNIFEMYEFSEIF